MKSGGDITETSLSLKKEMTYQNEVIKRMRSTWVAFLVVVLVLFFGCCLFLLFWGVFFGFVFQLLLLFHFTYYNIELYEIV